MKTKISSSFFYLALFFAIAATLYSCNKPPVPRAIVTVLNENNEPVEGAEVTVRADEGRVIYLTTGIVKENIQHTNAIGQVSYEFRYEAIYNIKVKTFKQKLVEKQGSGVFILKHGKTYKEIVRIR